MAGNHPVADGDADGNADRGRHEPPLIDMEWNLRAEARDARANARDGRANARDARAAARDAAAVARERANGRGDAGAGADRAEAQGDRQEAARDRALAALDRVAAWSDRSVWAAERDLLAIDGLTGVYRRGPGVVELEREATRALRTEEPLVIAFVDVDNLKATNDSSGHPAGDRLLRQVTDTMRDNLRTYDLIVRYGGDEFVCGLPGLHLREAMRRFERINEILVRGNASITVGLARLKEGECVQDVIDRAAASLYAHRRRQRFARS